MGWKATETGAVHSFCSTQFIVQYYTVLSEVHRSYSTLFLQYIVLGFVQYIGLGLVQHTVV